MGPPLAGWFAGAPCTGAGEAGWFGAPTRFTCGVACWLGEPVCADGGPEGWPSGGPDGRTLPTARWFGAGLSTVVWPRQRICNRLGLVSAAEVFLTTAPV